MEIYILEALKALAKPGTWRLEDNEIVWDVKKHPTKEQIDKWILENKDKVDLEINKLNLQKEARNYLLETDWYITRKLETNVEIPKEVSIKRQQAREVLDGS